MLYSIYGILFNRCHGSCVRALESKGIPEEIHKEISCSAIQGV